MLVGVRGVIMRSFRLASKYVLPGLAIGFLIGAFTSVSLEVLLLAYGALVLVMLSCCLFDEAIDKARAARRQNHSANIQ